MDYQYDVNTCSDAAFIRATIENAEKTVAFITDGVYDSRKIWELAEGKISGYYQLIFGEEVKGSLCGICSR